MRVVAGQGQKVKEFDAAVNKLEIVGLILNLLNFQASISL